MTKDYLFEIGTRRNASLLVSRSKQLADQKLKSILRKMAFLLKTLRLIFNSTSLDYFDWRSAEKQDDIDEVKKQPAKKIAQDKDGNWRKLLKVLFRGQGMTTDDIYFEELKGTEYAYMFMFKKKASSDILMGMSDIIKAMTLPTKMRWDSNILSLYVQFIDGFFWLAVVKIKLFDVVAGRKTQGHRF